MYSQSSLITFTTKCYTFLSGCWPLSGNETEGTNTWATRRWPKHVSWLLSCMFWLVLTCWRYCVHAGFALIANFVAGPAKKRAVVLRMQKEKPQ